MKKMQTACVAASMLAAAAACAGGLTFPYSIGKGGITSGGIYDADGRLVRALWALEPREPGDYEAEWDGLADGARHVVPGAYHLRVVVNDATYENVGILGNTGLPAGEPQHIQHQVSGICAGPDGTIYTANGWEEAGHDFKVFDPDGNTLFHARYQIRNGDPNGAPHAIAVDDRYIYCSMTGWANDWCRSRKQIQRFDIANGNAVPFTDPALAPLKGHIEFYEWPERNIPEGTPPETAVLLSQPIQDLAIHGDRIYATDAIANKVRVFDKETGAEFPDEAFAVTLPHDIAIDADGRIYVAHEQSKITRFSANGKSERTFESDMRIASLHAAPGGQLCVADGESCQVRFYDFTGRKAKLVRTFGGRAKPGTARPDEFYSLVGAAVDPAGNITTLGTVPCGGGRIARFAPDGTCLWEHIALAFCDVGGYDPERPDEFLSQRFHRIELGDKDAGEWRYTGTVIDGDPGYLFGNHGNPQYLRFGGATFLFQCYGDGMQIYRRNEADGTYRLASMVGGNEPWPDGRYNHDLPEAERRGIPWWTWSDEKGDGKVDPDEVKWFKQPGEARYAVFGMNVDKDGTLVFCDHHTQAIWELPMDGLDSRGNPRYDWDKVHEIVPRDESPARFFPLMAMRADDGTLYAMGRSAWDRPDGPVAGNVWMGGWALARYTAGNELIWRTPLPGVCPGMCAVPGDSGGVILGHFNDGEVYHYEPDGLLVGFFKPGEKAGKTSGWMDNTAAINACRDPRDGKLDIFVEDSWLNRIIWYRAVDSARTEIVTPAQEIPQMKAMKIACFGDSITDGETYALLVKQALKEAGRPVPVMVAAGIGGDTADGMLKRIQRDVLDYKPDLVIVNCGVNDVMRGKTAEQFKAECGELFDRITAAGAVPLAMLPTVITEAHGEKVAILDTFSDTMRLAAMERDIPICDLHSALQREMRAGGPPLISPDTIHLELAGYRVMTRELLDTLGYADVPVPQTLDVPELPGLVKSWKAWPMQGEWPGADAAIPEPPTEGAVELSLPSSRQASSWWPDQERRRGIAVEIPAVIGEGRWFLATATIDSETERDAWLVLGGEPRHAWLNGESVWSYDPMDHRGWHIGCLRIPVKLHAGANEIRLAVGNAFACCVTDDRESIDRDFGQE